MSKQLFFHIGSPKAGSTFLQMHVFPISPRFNYLSDWDISQKNRKIKNIIEFINDLFYAEKRFLTATFSNFDKFLQESAPNSNLPHLISYEYFTSRALKHFQLGNTYYAGDLEKAVERLKEFGIIHGYEVHIIFIQREFKEFIFSSYAQFYWRYRKLKPTKSIKEYLKSETGKENFKSGLFWFYGENMKKLLEKNFDSNRVHIFSFEELMNKEYTSSDRIDFEDLVGVGISSSLHKVENKRLVKADMRIATLSNPGVQEVFLYQYISKSIQIIREYFIVKKKQEIIKWDKECEDLFNRLENYFKNF
jgi:hypothetical protein